MERELSAAVLPSGGSTPIELLRPAATYPPYLSPALANLRPTSHPLLPLQTPDLELKKLVYLYLINYAKSQPDLAIMAVNTFVKVSSPSPLPIRSGRGGSGCKKPRRRLPRRGVRGGWRRLRRRGGAARA